MRKPKLEILDLNQVSAMLSITPRTLIKWCKKGQITHYKICGRIKFNYCDIMDYLEQNKDILCTPKRIENQARRYCKTHQAPPF